MQGRWLLSTNEHENVKTILGTYMKDFSIDKRHLWTLLPVLGSRSVFCSNEQQWHHARAMARPSFVRDQVADLRRFEQHIGNFLAAVLRDGPEFDMQELYCG